MTEKYNRIRAVLRAQGRTNKWLAAQLDRNATTVSRWCRNIQQPDLPTLFKVARLLNVPVCELINEEEE